jgi:hypothetical protein
MGWKASLIIIENRDGFKDDLSILKALWKDDFQFDSECKLEDCIRGKDDFISIGYIDGNIIIWDSFMITSSTLEKARNRKLSKEEKELIELFPESEIVSVACHSFSNYHGYSLIQNGEKLRIKTISSEDSIMEFGERTEEEEGLYKRSFQKDGKSFWKDEVSFDEDFAEDQMMEDFTFEFAKRRLGVRLDHSEGDELMNHLVLKKYKNPNQKLKPDEKFGFFKIIILVIVILNLLRLIH